MKKRNLLMFSIASLMLLSGCQNQNQDNVKEDNTTQKEDTPKAPEETKTKKLDFALSSNEVFAGESVYLTPVLENILEKDVTYSFSGNVNGQLSKDPTGKEIIVVGSLEENEGGYLNVTATCDNLKVSKTIVCYTKVEESEKALLPLDVNYAFSGETEVLDFEGKVIKNASLTLKEENGKVKAKVGLNDSNYDYVLESFKQNKIVTSEVEIELSPIADGKNKELKFVTKKNKEYEAKNGELFLRDLESIGLADKDFVAPEVSLASATINSAYLDAVKEDGAVIGTAYSVFVNYKNNFGETFEGEVQTTLEATEEGLVEIVESQVGYKVTPLAAASGQNVTLKATGVCGDITVEATYTFKVAEAVSTFDFSIYNETFQFTYAYTEDLYLTISVEEDAISGTLSHYDGYGVTRVFALSGSKQDDNSLLFTVTGYEDVHDDGYEDEYDGDLGSFGEDSTLVVNYDDSYESFYLTCEDLELEDEELTIEDEEL